MNSETRGAQLAPEIADFLESQGKVILSMSGGKDSLCAWALLEELGIEVRPFYMQMIPGLSWIEGYLSYLERAFSTPILRTQHPQTYQWLKTWGGQPPHRARAIDALAFPRFGYEDVENGVRRTLEMREPGQGWQDAWVAVGTRTTDSPQRRRSFKRLGWRRDVPKKVYPIHNFRKADLINVLVRRGVKLSPCYRIFGRSFDGADFRFLDGIRRRYPEDYRRILEWLPLQQLEFLRVKYALKHGVAVVT